MRKSHICNVEATQPSWDHEGMIAQEDRDIEAILENFALKPCDFTLTCS